MIASTRFEREFMPCDFIIDFNQSKHSSGNGDVVTSQIPTVPFHFASNEFAELVEWQQ
jgi:hypothetical protein